MNEIPRQQLAFHLEKLEEGEKEGEVKLCALVYTCMSGPEVTLKCHSQEATQFVFLRQNTRSPSWDLGLAGKAG